MDVRCEKCGTEYELDETRLKPGGVTVKCTSCGHMFKIRKRTATNVGMPAVPQPPSTPGHASSNSSGQITPPRGNAVPRPHTSTGSGPAGDRNWIIRLASGEQRTCKELATLQQWIIAGDVDRESMISRSGKTWKQLGDIPELAQFFQVAEQARPKRDTGRVTSPQPAQRNKPATPEVKATMLGMAPAPAPTARRPPTQPPPPPKAFAQGQGKHAPAPTALGAPPANDAARPPPTPPAMPNLPRAKIDTPVAAPPAPAPPPIPGLAAGAAQRSTGAWATDDVKPIAEADAGPAGPMSGKARVAGNGGAPSGFGGQIRSVPTHDVAFASSVRAGAVVEDLASDEDTGPVIPHRSGGGVGKWIAIGALALIAGAAAAIYIIVVRQDGGGDRQAAATLDAGVTADAGVVALAADAAAASVVDKGKEEVTVIAAREALRGDTLATLEAAATLLAGGGPGSADVERLALRARIATAIAQHREDEALLSGDAKAADKLRKDARKRVADALALAQKAKKTGAGTAGEAAALVAMGDVLRLQGKPAAEVTGNVGRALELAPDDREALYVSALLAIRDGETARGKEILMKLDSGDGALETSGDVRPRFRLAMIAWKAGDAPAAQKAAEDVLGIQPDHAGARKLLARLGDAVADDPMPPEDDPKVKVDAGAVTSGGGGGGGGEPKGDYDTLLSKADSLAEGGNCGSAMTYYAKALELKPNGVGALTGRGYCYIDTKQFASAHSSFRAALAVSRRYEPALWGVGEAYQQQGLKEKAIEAFMDYLEAYPGSAKAQKAIERLGGNVEAPPKEEPPKEEPPKGEQPKDEPPKEEPKEDPGAGGGSDPGTTPSE